MEEKEKYCHKCGAEIVEVKLDYLPWYMKAIGANEYSERTGEKITATHRKCPNARWYNLGHASITVCDRF